MYFIIYLVVLILYYYSNIFVGFLPCFFPHSFGCILVERMKCRANKVY